MWLLITGLILTALCWAGGLTLRAFGVPVPIWALIVATAVIVAGCVAIALLRRLQARLAARRLERELLAQAAAGPETPTQQAEIVELRVQLERGVRALKQSRLGAEGRDALYALPWYVIIGPPGVGKTTVLKQSGLNFPFLDPRSQGGVRGVGGTRNCDWWFTNEAVLLDTAGRYTMQEDDRVEWFTFLDLLRRYRKRKPINGVLVAVSAVELLEATTDQITTLARTLRARIDELTMRLDMVVPIYVTFTKADLIAGFVELFGDLTKSERDQVLGATADLQDAFAGHSVARFDEEFDALVERIQARAVRSIASGRGEARRARVFQFPLEFAPLKPRIAELLSTLFEDTGSVDRPVFRGFYFTSGTQEGSPVDRVISNVVRAMGLAPGAAPEARVEPRSFFIKNVFRAVVFPDKNVAGRTRRERRRHIMGRVAFAASAALLSAVLLSAPSCSFRNNMQLVSAARQAATSAASVTWVDDAQIPQNAEQLETPRKQLELLDSWQREGAPSRVRWGMYVGQTIRPPLRGVYVGAMELGVKQPALTVMRNNLRTQAIAPVDTRKRYQAAYDLLKLHLMTSSPEKLDPEWAAPRLTATWLDAVHSNNAERDKSALLPHVQYYLQLMKRGDVEPWPRDDDRVLRMRTQLLRTPRLDRLYEELISEANEKVAPIRHGDIFFGSVAPYVTYEKGVQVDGAYTNAGWARVRKLLGDDSEWLTGEAWVLGEGQKATQDQVRDELASLRTLYFERYKEAWRDFFTDIKIHEPENAQTALDELTALSEPVWPYQRLLKTLSDNAVLDVSEGEVAGAAKSLLKAAEQKLNIADAGSADAETKPISPVEEAFRPLIDFGVAPPPAKGQKKAQTGLDTYVTTISSLVAALSDLRDGAPTPDPGKVTSDFEKAYKTTSAQLTGQTGFTRPMLSSLLMRPISFAWGGVVRDAGSAASGLWEAEVWSKWQAKLQGRYPFKSSPDDATLDDFTAFFQPDKGILWGFYDKNLKASLKRDGNNFQPVRRFRSSVAYTDLFLGTCMKRGADITDLLFDEKATLGVDFDVNLHTVSEDVSQVTLVIDGASNTYQNHPAQWLEAHWPAASSKDRGASVRILGYNDLDEEIIRAGDFGFFRLLDGATSIAPGKAGGRTDGEPTIVATWKLRTRDAFVSVDIRPRKDERSLSSGLFKHYTCPRVIAR